MTSPYPPITPYSSGFLQVDDTHQLYWEQLGNPDGVPLVFLHGGPGGGASPIHRQYFDPHHYRIIIYDQRGAGRSHPLGSLANNTPDCLVDDLDKLRRHLKIDRWHLFGGSWGSTLALLYAIAYPTNCLSMVLHGIFLLDPEEIRWFTHRMGHIFPEAHREWLSFLPEDQRDNPLAAYATLLTSGSMSAQLEAARVWCTYEMKCSTLVPDPYLPSPSIDPRLLWALARIENHYFSHHLLTGDRGLLRRLAPALHIPLIIIQGRYDMICPVKSADDLHRAWPGSELVIVQDGGHSSLDRPMQRALVEASNRMRNLRAPTPSGI